jgi:hypothetical protein
MLETQQIVHKEKTMSDERTVMKTGLLIALVLIVLRIILEQLGAPEGVNNVFGVAWLYFVIPVFFGRSVAMRPRPYLALLKNVTLFGLYTRILVMITYMLAFAFRWQAPRFSAQMGGNVGDNVTPLSGLLVIPVRNALIWIVFSALLGMIIGGVTIWLVRRGKAAVSTP